MKKCRAYITSIVFICFSSHIAAQQAADTAFEKTIFWQITGNGSKDTSYLLGTIHVIFREDMRIAPKLLNAFLRSKVVFFESIPEENMDSIYKAKNLMDKPKLKRVLGEACYDLLVSKLKEYNDSLVNDPAFDALKPRYFNSIIMQHYLGKQTVSIDGTLISIALGNGQSIFALDSKETNDELLEVQTLNEQASGLYTTLFYKERVTSSLIKRIRDLTRLYYEGAIGTIYLQSVSNLTRFSEFKTFTPISSEKLLDERNKKWIPVMIGSLEKQASFFAFGSAHLAGRKGIINLLRKKGFTVSPIFLEY